MKRYITSSQESYQLYRNNRNENKYIEVRKTTDGHTEYRSFMFWNTDRGPVKNYYTSKSNKGRWHRGTKDSIKKMLEDYQMVESIEDGVKDSFDYAGYPENPNDIVSRTNISASTNMSKRDVLLKLVQNGGRSGEHVEDIVLNMFGDLDNFWDYPDSDIEKVYDRLRSKYQKEIAKYGDDAEIDTIAYDLMNLSSDVVTSCKTIFAKGRGKILASCIGNYKGYEVCQENDHDQRFYFLDDKKRLHFADLEEELKAKIDDYVDKKSRKIEAATYVQKLIRKRPKKDRNGEPLVYSGSGGRSLVGINYSSIDKFDSREAAEEDLKKYAKDPKEWEVVEFKSVESSVSTDKHDISDDLIMFLDDLDYNHHVFDDQDFSYILLTDEQERRLEKWMISYMAAAEEGRNVKCAEIASQVADYVEDLQSSLEFSEHVSGWYVGEPDPTGRLEGDIRYENKIHSWRDAYGEFIRIANKYFPDEEKIDEEIAKLYFRHSKNPFFQQAWMRWRDSGEDDIEASDEGLSPFIVYFTYDSGDGENGPIIQGGDDLMYAKDVDDAVDKWCDMFVDPNDTTFCGAWAEPADAEYVAKWKKYNE